MNMWNRKTFIRRPFILIPIMAGTLAVSGATPLDGLDTTTDDETNLRFITKERTPDYAATHDFGEVWIRGKFPQPSHDFVIDPVEYDRIVTSVRSTCGCTVASMSPPRLIPAGKPANLHAAMAISGPGPITHAVTVTFDDGKIGEYRLTATGKLDVLVSAIPSIVDWTATEDGGYSARVHILYRAGAPITEFPFLQVVDDHVTGSFTGWRTLESFDAATGRPLRLLSRVQLHSNDENPPVGKVQIHVGDGNVRDVWILAPQP